MKVSIIATVAIELEVDEDMLNEIKENLDLEEAPTAQDIRDYWSDQCADNLEEVMSNYGFSCDDPRITVK